MLGKQALHFKYSLFFACIVLKQVLVELVQAHCAKMSWVLG